MSQQTDRLTITMPSPNKLKMSIHDRLLLRTKLMRKDENPAYIHSRKRGSEYDSRNLKSSELGTNHSLDRRGHFLSSGGKDRNPLTVRTIDATSLLSASKQGGMSEAGDLPQ